MSFQVQPVAEGSFSESVHFPPTSSFPEHQGYHVDGRMTMVPPLSSASRVPPRGPFLHDDGRGGSHYVHSGGFDRPEYDYAMRRHSCGDHLGLHSGALIEHLLLQENQKALRMANLVQSQASGCLSGCLSCGLGEKRLRFSESEERMVEEQRRCSRNVGEGPSRSVNLGSEAETVECADGWFRQPPPRESIGGVGERNQARHSFSEEELGRSLCQGRRAPYPVAHPALSFSQASHHVQDHQLHPVGATEGSVPIYGFSDANGRVRQRWSSQRQSYSGNGAEDDGWQRATRHLSRVGQASAREQDRLSLPGIATGSFSRPLVGSPHRPVGDSVRPPQSTRTASQSIPGMPENSMEPSYQDNALREAGTQRVVTQGPVSLTNWYIMKVQTAAVGRVLETKVAVGGWLVQNREHVKTSPIANRLDFHKVVTEDGVEVSLEGSMDQETSASNGFSPGIVQCLSAGFPYMWKTYMRVRPVGGSSSAAVSESLGGLHPIASKCVSEDESHGVVDPKTTREDIPSSSRDCEGNSPVGVNEIDAAAVNENPLVIQTPISTTSDAAEIEVVETEEVVTAKAKTSNVVETVGVETEAVVIARARKRAKTSNAVDTEAVETEAVMTARAKTRAKTSNAVVIESLETEVVATAWAKTRAKTSNVMETEAVETEGMVTAREKTRARTSNAVETETEAVVSTRANKRSKTSNVVVTEAVGTDRVVTAGSKTRAKTSNAVVTEAVETESVEIEEVTTARPKTRAKTSNSVVTEAVEREALETAALETQSLETVEAETVETEVVVTTGAETSNAVETQSVYTVVAVTPRAETSNAVEAGAVDTEAVVTARAETSNALDEGSPQDVLFDETCDACPISLDTVPVTEAPLRYIGNDSLAKQAESGPTVDTTFVTVRRGRKNKKGLSKPVRSSRRLQQIQSRSGKFMPTLVNSTGLDPTEQTISGMKITKDKSGEEEPAEIAPDTGPVPTERQKLTSTNSIIEEVLRDLQEAVIEEVLKDVQEADVEAADQGGYPEADSVGFAVDPQPMEVENLVQVQDHCGNLCKDSDGVEGPKLKEKEAIEVELACEEIEQTSPVAPLELESEVIEAAHGASPELESKEIQESAPVTPPELLQSKVQLRVDSVDIPRPENFPQANEERVFPEVSARMTRSLKRRLRLSAITEAVAEVAPVTRSLKRLRRLSDVVDPSVEPVSNPDTPHQEGPSVKPVSNPDTPHQEEVNTFYVRVRDHNTRSTKAVSCSNCKQPCSPQELETYNSILEVTPEQMAERVLKVEQEEYAPLAPQHTAETSGNAEQPNKGKTESRSMKRESRRPKKLKSATRSEMRGATRRLNLDASGEGSTEDCEPFPSKRSIRRTSIIPPPLPSPRVQDKSKVPEAFGLKTSRSGRLLVPPLAYWRSQSIEYDKDGGIIAIFDGFQAKPADTGCFNFTPPQEKRAKRIQDKLCKAATTTVKKRK